MSNTSEIEVNFVFNRYDQKSLERFTKDLTALAAKWQLHTKSTSFIVREQKMRKSQPTSLNIDPTTCVVPSSSQCERSD